MITPTMTVVEAERLMADHGITFVKTIRVAGMVWAITGRVVACADDLATALGRMVALHKGASMARGVADVPATNHDTQQ